MTASRVSRFCWLGNNAVHESGTMPLCDGYMRRCHLIPLQQLKKARVPAEHWWDDRILVWGCGGIIGNAGHHGMLDTTRSLRVPRERLPASVLVFAREYGLTAWVEREYGPATPNEGDADAE